MQFKTRDSGEALSKTLKIEKIGKLKQCIWHIFASGLPVDYDIEALRKILLINLIILLASFMIIVLGIIEIILEDYVLSLVNFTFFAFVLGLFIYLRKTKNYDLISLVGTTAAGFFYFFLIAHGGTGKTTYMWLFTYPLISIFLLGLRKGTIYSLTLLALACLVFAFGSKIEFFTAYSPFVKMRFVPAYLTIFFLIIIIEKTRMIAQEKMKQSEKRYRLLADNINDNVWIFDLETMRFSYVSPSITGITGFTEEEAIGSRLKDAMTPLSFERVNKILEEELASSSQNFDPTRSRTMELEFYKKNGSTVWTETVAKFIYDQKSQPIALLGATRDISERKKFQDQLHKSQKMESLGLLAGGVAHDLNNVLSGIVSYPELLLINLPDDSNLRKPLQTIMKSGLKAAAIVQDLLTIARGVAIIKEPLKLNDLVADYFDSPEFKKLKHFYPGVTFKTNLADGLLNINASDIHIRKVLMNLIANATEAVQKNGNVSVSSDNRFLDRPLKGYEEIDIGEYAVLTVADDGPGISIRDLQKIFEPFYTKKKMGRSGTGLGLSVVWNVIRDHKGYIDVKSDASGTLFELYFPISRDAILKTDINLSLTSYKGSGEIILVVDDIESQREISSRMLDMLGYKYKSVSSGEKAIEYLKQNTVDLILLDMIMDPGINGYETYKRIIKIYPGQKAIILSGFSATGDVKNTQSLGVGKYLKKPITLEKLGLAIKEELEK